MRKTEDLKIKCADGFELSVTLYEPAVVVKAAVMIGSATGIKKEFYNSFSTFLAQRGYGVISYDNRGIGKSKNFSINNCKASLVSWGKLDMPAVLEKLQSVFPDTSYHLIGHSAGGQLVGLMYNATDITSMLNFASSSGSIKNMNYPFKLHAAFLLNVFLPLSNLLFGCTKAQWVGMGEPLPKLVALQWRKWCNGKGYVAMDFGKSIKKHWYDELTFPSQWLYATDDDMANLENVKDMIRVYTKTDAAIVALDPQKLGYKEIGHMKFFSSKNEGLWSYVLNWLEIHEK